MSEISADTKRIAREVGSIARRLSEIANRWEPPTERDIICELARVVAVLQELYPEPEWDDEA